MPGQPSPPAKGDWSATKQAIVIAACSFGLIILIAAIAGAASSPGAAPLAGSTVTRIRSPCSAQQRWSVNASSGSERFDANPSERSHIPSDI
jgi:hypothetical protein